MVCSLNLYDNILSDIFIIILIFYKFFFLKIISLNYMNKNNKLLDIFYMGIGDWGLGDWGLGIGDRRFDPLHNPQSPIPNPQSPIPMCNKH